MVKNLPFGYARAISILKELVPMSIAAKRDVTGVGGAETVEAMDFAIWVLDVLGYNNAIFANMDCKFVSLITHQVIKAISFFFLSFCHLLVFMRLSFFCYCVFLDLNLKPFHLHCD